MIQKDANVERLKKMENKQFESLVAEAIKGNNEAFEEIIRIKLEPIVYGALSIMKQQQDAEDAAQDIILKLYKDIRKLREPKAFNLWLHKVITNHCYTLKTKKKRKKEQMNMDEHLLEIEEQDREFLPQIYAEDKEYRLLVRGLIENLSDQKRQIVTMYYYDELSYKEISEVLGIPVNTVGSELKRAKEQLKTELEKTGTFNKNDINKFAAVPVLSQILTEHAHEVVSNPVIESLMTYTQKDVITGAAMKKAGLFTWKKVCAGVLCTMVLTGGVVYACDGLSNFNTGGQADGGTIITESAVDQSNGKTPTGEIGLVSGDCDCGHANPKEIIAKDLDQDYESASWTITNKKTNEQYKGQGTEITKEVANLHENKLDGEYTVEFTVKYSYGDFALKRDFLIYTGNTPPENYDK